MVGEAEIYEHQPSLDDLEVSDSDDDDELMPLNLAE